MAAKLQVLRLRYKAVYVGRSPAPYLALRERVCASLEGNSFRTTANLEERSAMAVHFAGGRDSDEADFERLQAIESTAPRVTTFVFVPFGADLSSSEKFWLGDARIGGKPITDATRWIQRKHEQELLDVLEDELTRLALPAPTAAEVVLACNPVDEPKAQWLRRQMALAECRVSLADHNLAPTSADRLRRWTTLVRTARALVYCWGQSDQETLCGLERLARERERTGPDPWYLLEPDVEQKLSQRPDAFSRPEDLAAFLDGVCRGLRAAG